MYDPSKFLHLDPLKGHDLWKDLSKYNCDLEKVWDTGMDDGTPVVYDLEKGGASPWFNPREFKTIPYSSVYPKNHPVQVDERFNLAMDCYGHFILAVLILLYGDRKDILVEEIGVGMGNLIFYLSKLGYRNFNFIDNFSQISKRLLDKVMTTGDIKYTLNDHHFQATVTNIVQCTDYVKKSDNGLPIVPDSLELFSSYVDVKPGVMNLSTTWDRFFDTNNFTCLARDPYQMMYFFCREDKYVEFKQKLGPLTI